MITALVLSGYISASRPTAVAKANGCTYRVGSVVRTDSGDIPSGIRLYDSRFALLDAVRGLEREPYIRHYVEIADGVRASVVDCSPVYGLVGLHVGEGRYRGKYGWTTSDEITDDR